MKLYQTRSLVLRIAAQLRKRGYSFSEAQRAAWQRVKVVEQPENAAFLTFQKVNGQVTTRLVSLGQLSDFIELKGTGRTLLPGLKPYIDLAKFYAGERNPVISVYQDSVRGFQPFN